MERDALMSAVKVVLAAPPAPVASPESRSAAYLTMAMAERELNAGNYAEAAQTAGFADQIAKKTNDPSLVDRVHGRGRVLSIAAVEYVRIKDQVAALKGQPEDAAANLAVGGSTLFILDRPSKAMPLLAKGVGCRAQAWPSVRLPSPPPPPTSSPGRRLGRRGKGQRRRPDQRGHAAPRPPLVRHRQPRPCRASPASPLKRRPGP